ncbi:MAG: DUF882 domain-containing protein [Desulfosarcinaceae bacterium]
MTSPMGRRITSIIILSLILWLPGKAPAREKAGRFFHHGNGEIRLASAKNGAVFSGRYRDRVGRYDEAALKAISRVFGAPPDSRRRYLSLRLVAFLDYLQDHFRPTAKITIISGYRRPEYNRALRRQGALAAKASLHQYGMAADIRMEGVASRRIWEYVKALGFGGAGYYHGKNVHIDVGPARFWDEKTSGVGSGLADDNKLIGLVSDYDTYAPGDSITLDFIRMTAFPIDVRRGFVLMKRTPGAGPQRVLFFSPEFQAPVEGPCPRFGDIDQMAAVKWQLPLNLQAGRYQVQAVFCDNPWDKMPAEIQTPEFQVIKP